MIEMVKLRTGYEAVKPVLIATKMSIDALLEKGMAGFTALYDLREIAKDSSYIQKVFPSNLKMLQDLALVDGNGTVHDEIRQVVLALIDGDGIDMKIVNPLAKE